MYLCAKIDTTMKPITDTTKQNPRLMSSTLKDGRISLYLEYYLGRTQIPILDDEGKPVYYDGTNRPKYKIRHERRKEALELYLFAHPKNSIEKAQNKEKLAIAQEIRMQRELELRSGRIGYRVQSRSVNLYDFFDSYIEAYAKNDKRMIVSSIARFKSFCEHSYPHLSKTIRPSQLTPELMEKFADYLLTLGKGEGPLSYFKRWRKVIRAAVKAKVIESDVCEGIRCGVAEDTIKKDILSQEEIIQLLSTTYRGQNMEIWRAFAFSLYAGLRYCDVSRLQYRNVDYSNRILRFSQSKTEGHSSANIVTIPLNDSLLSLIGDKKNNDDLIFNLPSHTMCLKALRHWVSRAGIDKHITWHCARHSFAVNILTNGANIKVVSELLGHSSLKYTDKYVRAIDSAKQQAINSLPEINIPKNNKGSEDS